MGKTVQVLNPLEIVREWNDYRKLREQEQTKREQIWAQRDVVVTQLLYQRDMMLAYMDHTFAERAAALQFHYAALDNGLAHGNDATIERALSGIIEIVRQSPFAGFREFVETMKHSQGSIEL